MIPSNKPCASSLSLQGASIEWVEGRQSSKRAEVFSYENDNHTSSLLIGYTKSSSSTFSLATSPGNI